MGELYKSIPDKIIERAHYIFDKPKKTKGDQILMIASILICGMSQGKGWVDETLKKFGWEDPITDEEKQNIMKKAEQIITGGAE